MATYNQYSEVVAAYGYTTPPPPQPQANRVGLALLYAAVGVALGTMTGTTMAVVSMQNTAGLAWPHSLALFRPAPTPAPNVHPSVAIANTHQAMTAAPAAAPAQVSAAPSTSVLAKVVPASVVEASVDINSTGLPSHARTAPAKLTPAPAVHPVHVVSAALPVPHKYSAPPAKPAVLSMPESVAPPAVEDISLDDHVRAMPAVVPAMFYSEGDASVVDYDADAGTIATNDGKTFVVGPTVSMANAPTWDDYRSNVHYRCDQSGKCSLLRTGVIALNARMI